VGQGTITSLRQAVELSPVVVNCSGAGARSFVPDPGLTPVRGQLVVVENPGVNTFFMEHDDSPAPTYYLPHGDHVALGGSAEPGRRTSAAIRRRCAAVEPALASARVLAQRVGIRPSRARVRLEPVRVNGGLVVHNYGHGGAGVTVSWGCARQVLGLIRERTRA